MAAKDQDQDDDDKAKPNFDPKAVNIGGESIADRLLPHVKKIMVMFILVAFVITVIFMISWRKTVKQEDDTTKLMQVLDVARTPINPEAKADAKEPTFKTNKDRAVATLDAMTKQGVDGGPLYKAGVLVDAGKLDEAITTYRLCEQKPGLDGVLCREGLGLALEQKATATQDPGAKEKLLTEALGAFTAMQPDEAGPRRAFALYHQGRLQATLGKKTEAKALLEKARTLATTAETQSREEQIAPYQLAALIQRRLASL